MVQSKLKLDIDLCQVSWYTALLKSANSIWFRYVTYGRDRLLKYDRYGTNCH